MKKVILAFILLSVSTTQAVMAHYHASARVKALADVDTLREDTARTLRGVTVIGNKNKDNQMKTSVNTVTVDRNYIATNFSGSLMQSLNEIPGVRAMSIGSGQSKPSIRGLGFNRMVVAEDGIKHEAQQWGDDHGLEIDQFAIDRIEIIKGPAALTYGSDAIGGVVNLYSNSVPTDRLSGSASVFGRTNNESIGLSTRLEGRNGKFFWRANATAIDFADYIVPTDSIEYYSYRIPLHNRRLRNTAGKELDGGITLGYMGYRFRTHLRLTDTYSKSGFFANAHGLEVRLSEIDYDRLRRDIDLPYHSVNHLKIMSHSVYQMDHASIEVDLAYQNNKRMEQSEPVSHGYMPNPGQTLERQFLKHTLSGQLKLSMPLADKHLMKAGVNAEYQHNRRGGWGFIIPDFETLSFGAYLTDRFTISPNLFINAGARFDIARLNMHSYYDWFKTPISDTDSIFKQRSEDRRRNFNSLSWSAGVNYSVANWVLKANIGKSFRMPIPKELGADGVNYHIFRYEKGNINLKPETSYQIDAGIHWSNETFSVQADPYLNYFPNYIYMNPTAYYYEGLQLYEYTQSRVIRHGVEIQANWHISPAFEAEASGIYLKAKQLSGVKKGYPLPFSTPWSVDCGLKYHFDRRQDNLGVIGINMHIVGDQNDIVPPEKPTPGYYTINFTASKEFKLKSYTIRTSLNGENLLNRKYYDHINYYRLMNIPEPGRNIAMMLTVEF